MVGARSDRTTQTTGLLPLLTLCKNLPEDAEELVDVGVAVEQRPTRDLLPEDAEELVDLGVAVEQRPTRDHLGKDAAHRPQIDRRRVTCRTQQHFRCAVPQCHNLQSTTNM